MIFSQKCYGVNIDKVGVDKMVDTYKSSSIEQQNAEVYVASMVERWLGCQMEKNAKVLLSSGVHIEPDLYSKDERIICEIFVHIGTLKSGQKNKVSRDILKMLLLEKTTGFQYRKIIVVADDKVENCLKHGKSFIAESIRKFGIEVKKIDLSDEVRMSVSNAQVRQKMINSDL